MESGGGGGRGEKGAGGARGTSPWEANRVLRAVGVCGRSGGGRLVMPGFSSPRVARRARLFVAIGIALALTPMLATEVPTASASWVMELSTALCGSASTCEAIRRSVGVSTESL